MTFEITKKSGFIINLLKKIILFGVTVIVISLIYNFINPQGISLITPRKQIILGDESIELPIFRGKNKTSMANIQNHLTITKIDVSQALEYFFDTETIFLDARDRSEYKAGHVPGAINIPVMEIDIFTTDFLQFEPEQKFVCYCNNENCDLAMRLAVWLEGNGFNQILYFAGGWDEWQQSGSQISKGDKP